MHTDWPLRGGGTSPPHSTYNKLSTQNTTRLWKLWHITFTHLGFFFDVAAKTRITKQTEWQIKYRFNDSFITTHYTLYFIQYDSLFLLYTHTSLKCWCSRLAPPKIKIKSGVWTHSNIQHINTIPSPPLSHTSTASLCHCSTRLFYNLRTVMSEAPPLGARLLILSNHRSEQHDNLLSLSPMALNADITIHPHSRLTRWIVQTEWVSEWLNECKLHDVVVVGPKIKPPQLWLPALTVGAQKIENSETC